MDSLPISCKLTSTILLEIIRTQTEIARCGMDLGDVMALVCEQAQALTHATGAVVEISDNEKMVYKAVSGIASAQLGLCIPKEGSLSGLCVQTGQALLCDDCETDFRVNKLSCQKMGVRSMVIVPLVHLGLPVGALKVISTSVNAFSEKDIAILQLMSDLIAASMFHAGKFETNELFHRATHDSLTTLANRGYYMERLCSAISQAKRKGELIGILSIDMDGLKQINDSFGHRAGDSAIHEVARRIQMEVRESDLAARIGGDEFSVILSKIRGRGNAEEKKRKINARIDNLFEFEGNNLKLRASIGIAIYPYDGCEIEKLVDFADNEMYKVKNVFKMGGSQAVMGGMLFS